MNFETLKVFHREYDFDEVQIIGKDVSLDGEPFHIAAVARCGNEAKLFMISRCESFEEMNKVQKISEDASNRERMRASFDCGRGNAPFLKEIRQGEQVITFRSSSAGNIENGDYVQGYVLFMRLMDAGWKPEEQSCFYQVDWRNIALTEVTLAGEFDALPELNLGLDAPPVMGMTSPGADSGLLSIPVLLEKDREHEISFVMKDGTNAVCYINRVYSQDMWEEQERQFADEEYRSKMLQHMNEEQLNQMKERLDAALENICPRGKHFLVVEYECSEDVSLKFYGREYLDAVPKPSKGSASMIMMHIKPDKNSGNHDLKLQACVVETPVEPETVRLEAELFSYTKVIPSREVRLF